MQLTMNRLRAEQHLHIDLSNLGTWQQYVIVKSFLEGYEHHFRFPRMEWVDYCNSLLVDQKRSVSPKSAGCILISFVMNVTELVLSQNTFLPILF